jgi:hypothetical protein
MNTGRRKMNKKTPIYVVLVSVLMISIPALAHHGTAAYDMTKSLALKGTITSFSWEYSHAEIAWDVKTENDGVEHWAVELTSPGMLTRSGWHHDSVKPGDEVTVYLHPAKNGKGWGILQKVVFSDGRPALIDPRVLQ